MMINDSQEKTKNKNEALNLRENVKVSIQMAYFETGMTKETILKHRALMTIQRKIIFLINSATFEGLLRFLTMMEIFSDDFRSGDSKTDLKWVKYNIF